MKVSKMLYNKSIQNDYYDLVDIIRYPKSSLIDVIMESVKFLRKDAIDRHIKEFRDKLDYSNHLYKKDNEFNELFLVWRKKPNRFNPTTSWRDDLIDTLGYNGLENVDLIPFACQAMLKNFDKVYGEFRELKKSIGRYATRKSKKNERCSKTIWKGVRLNNDVLIPKWPEFPHNRMKNSLAPKSGSVKEDFGIMTNFVVPGEMKNPRFVDNVCYVIDEKLQKVFEQYVGNKEKFKIGCVSLLSKGINCELEMKTYLELSHNSKKTKHFRFSGYKNAKHAKSVVKKAIKYMIDKKVQVVVFPELTIYGDSLDTIKSMLDEKNYNDPPHLVVAGSRHKPLDFDEKKDIDWEDPNAVFVNEATILDGKGNTIYTHHKFAKFSTKVDGTTLIEGVKTDRPEFIPVFDIGIGIAIVLICKDFLSSDYNWLSESGVDFWLIPSMSDEVGSFKAASGICYNSQGIMAYANTCGVFTEKKPHKRVGFVYFPSRFSSGSSPSRNHNFYGCNDKITEPCGSCCVGVLAISHHLDFKSKIL